jgi:hypothetical protein
MERAKPRSQPRQDTETPETRVSATPVAAEQGTRRVVRVVFEDDFGLSLAAGSGGEGRAVTSADLIIRPAEEEAGLTRAPSPDVQTSITSRITDPRPEQARPPQDRVVVDVAELEALKQRLAEAEQAAVKLERQRELRRARNKRWRERHPEEAKQRSRENVRAYRARKQGGADQS